MSVLFSYFRFVLFLWLWESSFHYVISFVTFLITHIALHSTYVWYIEFQRNYKINKNHERVNKMNDFLFENFLNFTAHYVARLTNDESKQPPFFCIYEIHEMPTNWNSEITRRTTCRRFLWVNTKKDVVLQLLRSG